MSPPLPFTPPVVRALCALANPPWEEVTSTLVFERDSKTIQVTPKAGLVCLNGDQTLSGMTRAQFSELLSDASKATPPSRSRVQISIAMAAVDEQVLALKAQFKSLKACRAHLKDEMNAIRKRDSELTPGLSKRNVRGSSRSLKLSRSKKLAEQQKAAAAAAADPSSEKDLDDDEDLEDDMMIMISKSIKKDRKDKKDAKKSAGEKKADKQIPVKSASVNKKKVVEKKPVEKKIVEKKADVFGDIDDETGSSNSFASLKNRSIFSEIKKSSDPFATAETKKADPFPEAQKTDPFPEPREADPFPETTKTVDPFPKTKTKTVVPFPETKPDVFSATETTNGLSDPNEEVFYDTNTTDGFPTTAPAEAAAVFPASVTAKPNAFAEAKTDVSAEAKRKSNGFAPHANKAVFPEPKEANAFPSETANPDGFAPPKKVPKAHPTVASRAFLPTEPKEADVFAEPSKKAEVAKKASSDAKNANGFGDPFLLHAKPELFTKAVDKEPKPEEAPVFPAENKVESINKKAEVFGEDKNHKPFMTHKSADPFVKNPDPFKAKTAQPAKPVKKPQPFIKYEKPKSKTVVRPAKATAQPAESVPSTAPVAVSVPVKNDASEILIAPKSVSSPSSAPSSTPIVSTSPLTPSSSPAPQPEEKKPEVGVDDGTLKRGMKIGEGTKDRSISIPNTQVMNAEFKERGVTKGGRGSRGQKGMRSGSLGSGIAIVDPGVAEKRRAMQEKERIERGKKEKERARRRAEEDARILKKVEEEKRLREQEEEQERLREIAKEEERLRKIEEEEMRIRKMLEEEERLRLKLEEENRAREKLEEERRLREKAEEEKRLAEKKAEEERVMKKLQEEARIRKKLEEEQRLKEEAEEKERIRIKMEEEEQKMLEEKRARARAEEEKRKRIEEEKLEKEKAEKLRALEEKRAEEERRMREKAKAEKEEKRKAKKREEEKAKLEKKKKKEAKKHAQEDGNTSGRKHGFSMARRNIFPFGSKHNSHDSKNNGESSGMGGGQEFDHMDISRKSIDMSRRSMDAMSVVMDHPDDDDELDNDLDLNHNHNSSNGISNNDDKASSSESGGSGAGLGAVMQRGKVGTSIEYLMPLSAHSLLNGIDITNLECLTLTADGTNAIYSSTDGFLYSDGRGGLSDAILKALRLSTSSPVSLCLGSFGRYYIKFANGSEVWSRQADLDKDVERGNVTKVAFGDCEDTYVVQYNDGSLRWCNIREELEEIFSSNQYADLLEAISLGPNGEYFVRDANNAIAYGCENENTRNFLDSIDSARLKDVMFGNGGSVIVRCML